jgi:hypothetical protein
MLSCACITAVKRLGAVARALPPRRWLVAVRVCVCGVCVAEELLFLVFGLF